MPGSYLIDSADRLVYSRAWGRLTAVDLTSHARTLRDDSRFDPSFRQIADLREVTEFRVSGPNIQLLATMNPFGPGSRRALIVVAEVAHGLARMYEASFATPPEGFRIFPSLSDGFAWLGLDAQTRWPARKPDATFGAV